MVDTNSVLDAVVGEADLLGGGGFVESCGNIIQDGLTTLAWNVPHNDTLERKEILWARMDFRGSHKRIMSILVRPIVSFTNLNNFFRDLEEEVCL